MDLHELQWVGAALGAFVSLLAVIKWIWPLVKQGYRNIMNHARVQESLDELQDQLGFVLSELKPNGGSSIKDAIERIEDCVGLTNEVLHARMLDSDQMIFRTDEEGRIRWVNRTFARTVQRLPAELHNHGWYNIIAEPQRDRCVERWTDAVKEKRELEMTMDFKTPDGATFPVLLRTYHMSKKGGRSFGYLATITQL